MTSSVVLAIIYILMTPLPWWAVVIIHRARKGHPDLAALNQQSLRFKVAGVAGTAIGVLAANYLAGILHLPTLPTGASFALLAVAVLAIYAQPTVFIIDFYRR